MANRVHQYWVTQASQLKAEHPLWGAPRLTEALGKMAAMVSDGIPEARQTYQHVSNELAVVGDPPSERWVSQWLRNDWPKVRESERRQYGLVRWPGSFESGALPWAMSPQCLELLLLRQRLAEHKLGEWRPTVRLARWFYRVTMAAPRLDARHRHVLAFMMTGHENGLFTPRIVEAVEAWLMHWERPQIYERIANRHLIELSEMELMLNRGFDQADTGSGIPR